jgi:hypothetical protein
MSYAKQAVTRLTLDMGLPDVQKSVSLTVGDTNRRLEVTLIDKGSPFALPPTWTAVLAGVLPSGDELYESCVVDDGRIVFDFVAANAVSSEEGVFAVAFDVFDEGGELVASPKIWMHVTPSVRRLRETETLDRLTALREFVESISRVDAELSTHAEQIGELESGVDLINSQLAPVLAKYDHLQINRLEIGADVWSADGAATLHYIGTIGGYNDNENTKAFAALLVPMDADTVSEAVAVGLEVAYTSAVGGFIYATLAVKRKPAKDMRFAAVCFTLDNKTGEEFKASCAIVGVGGGGGTNTGGVDQSAVEDTVKRLIPAWALEEEPPEERDPSVYNWAKAATKPSYTAEEVGADPYGTAVDLLSFHNVSVDAHNDIRMLVEEHREEVNALLAVDDSTLDELSEIVAYIKNNKSLIESITDSKVSKTDIVNNLTTNVTNKPLSAAQGVVIKTLIDAKIGTENLADEVAAQIEAAKENGELGVRGPGVLKVSTTPTSWTQAIGGKNPVKKMSIATIKKEADVDEVIIGDNIQHSSYLYRIYYLDDTYAYMDTAQNLKGSQGSAGKSAYKYAQDGGYTGTEAQFTESLAIAGDIENHIPGKTSQLTNDSGYVTSSNAETWTFTLANGSTVTKKVVLA